MSKYLLDTNICIYYIKGRFELAKKFDDIPSDSLFISEITLAELKFGISYSQNKSKNTKALNDFDLLIGSTAIANDLVLVTNNIKHFENLKNIQLENWVE